MGLIPDQDTTVFQDGFNVGEAYGTDETFLVQHGVKGDQAIPTAIALMTFPMADVPAFDRLDGLSKNAILRLFHEVTPVERGEATYTIVRLPETNMAVETFHGLFFFPPKDEDQEPGYAVGPSFLVKPEDTVIDIDITSLLFDDNPNENQFFIMLQDRGDEQPEGGDRFYSRESVNPPQLLIDFTGGDASTAVVSVPTPENSGTFDGDENRTDAPSFDDGNFSNMTTTPSITPSPSTSLSPSVISDDNMFAGNNETNRTDNVFGSPTGTGAAAAAPAASGGTDAGTTATTAAPSTAVPAVRRGRRLHEE
jgi:hypothetical protein